MLPDPVNKSLKIICFGYREWSHNIYKYLSEDIDLISHSFIIANDSKLVNEEFIKSISPDLILFYGWSQIINPEILDNYFCLMLHPSSLPKYRGGSPIQNQIIEGLIETEVCIFKMEAEIDSGAIVARAPLTLEGEIKDIFLRLEKIGFKLTKYILLNGFYLTPQIGEPIYRKRRRPEDSLISIEELKNESSIYLFNKIRMLSDPYPNAYILCADGKKLYIKKAELE